MPARISIQARPGAPANEITGFSDGVFHIKVAAPPVEGKANRELVEFLSQRLGIPKSSLAIVRGHTSRHKVIDIQRLSQEEVMRRLCGPSSSARPGK